ncbi:unnamed protein product [Lactuca virosa]|uniref:Uncharacterized protein n=1 Tax=Lactuca virosa TaxID=75947 RepID=A0AAU9MZF9_9ASTR|nr:unnamed protein product [Lactuca virosa]
MIEMNANTCLYNMNLSCRRLVYFPFMLKGVQQLKCTYSNGVNLMGYFIWSFVDSCKENVSIFMKDGDSRDLVSSSSGKDKEYRFGHPDIVPLKLRKPEHQHICWHVDQYY